MEYTNIQYQIACHILGEEGCANVTVLSAGEYPQRQDLERVTHASYTCDLLHSVAPIIIQYGDEVSNETVMFREEWAVLSLGAEYRAKLLDVETINAPPHNLDIFPRFSISTLTRMKSRMQMGHAGPKLSHNRMRRRRKVMFLESWRSKFRGATLIKLGERVQET